MQAGEKSDRKVSVAPLGKLDPGPATARCRASVRDAGPASRRRWSRGPDRAVLLLLFVNNREIIVKENMANAQ